MDPRDRFLGGGNGIKKKKKNKADKPKKKSYNG